MFRQGTGLKGKACVEVARSLNLNHGHNTVEIEEAITVIPEVIKILESFDPAIPNDVVVYIELQYAKEMACG